MSNNDIFKSLRYTFDIDDFLMIEIFALANRIVTREQVCNWLKKEEDEAFVSLVDKDLATFLAGFIVFKRGKKEGEEIIIEKSLNNNLILKKLKIALAFKDTEMLELINSRGLEISKHELSALFRHPDQSQYRPCKDQILRNFIFGLQR